MVVIVMVVMVAMLVVVVVVVFFLFRAILYYLDPFSTHHIHLKKPCDSGLYLDVWPPSVWNGVNTNLHALSL